MFPLCFQSNAMLPESLRNSDKRRNGPDFLNDSKKRKVEDKDSSHYVRHQRTCVCACVCACVCVCVCVCASFHMPF